jgi:uncharacterized membrane protein (UPF0127 family)
LAKIFESPVTRKPGVRYSACLRLRVTNLTRQTELGDSIDLADTSAKRRTGLLKHERLAAGEGMWIVPCASVHTFFMKFPIDLVYVGKDRKVRKVRHAVKPWRMSACLRAHSTLELPAGAAAKSGTQTGDELGVETLRSE